MKKRFPILSLCGLAAVVISLSGCAHNAPPDSLADHRDDKGGPVKDIHYPLAPVIGSPAWLAWVDKRVDTRYANGIRPDPGTPEWYAIVDYEVFIRDFYNDHYPTGYYRRGGYLGYFSYSDVRTNADGTRPIYEGARSGQSGAKPNYDGYQSGVEGYRPNYDEQPGHYHGNTRRVRDNYFGPARFSEHRRNYKLGSPAWKREVTIAILTGRVPKPPARTDPWDAPLSPTN